MSQYYRPQRTRNIYNPNSPEPFKLSRSKIELFMNCPRCFYLDRRLGIGQPPGFPFNLNSAVDTLLKKEFDYYRSRGETHPLITLNGIDAKPFQHDQLEEWRDSLRRGIKYHHLQTNLIITGGVDDVWQNTNGELIIVDYKATSKSEPVGINSGWQIGYKRQMSLYAWLFKKNDFRVADTGYFVYCNGLVNRDFFNQRLEFDVSLIPYKIDDSWVEQNIIQAHQCLNLPQAPKHSADCDFCQYLLTAGHLPLQ